MRCLLPLLILPALIAGCQPRASRGEQPRFQINDAERTPSTSLPTVPLTPLEGRWTAVLAYADDAAGVTGEERFQFHLRDGGHGLTARVTDEDGGDCRLEGIDTSPGTFRLIFARRGETLDLVGRRTGPRLEGGFTARRDDAGERFGQWHAERVSTGIE